MFAYKIVLIYKKNIMEINFITTNKFGGGAYNVLE